MSAVNHGRVTVVYVRDALSREVARSTVVELISPFETAVGVAQWAIEELRGQDLVLAVNGVEVKEPQPGEKPQVLKDGDTVAVSKRPGTGVDIALVAIAIISAVASAALIAGIKSPLPSGSNDPEENRYGFNRVSNNAFVGDPIPVLFGERPIGGKVIALVPIESEDGAGESRLKMLICLSEGELGQIANQTADFDDVLASDLTGIEINDQPIANFAGIKASGRMGSSGQDMIPGFDDVETLREVGVGGVTLPNTSGSDRTGGSASGEAYLYTTAAAVNAVTLRVRFAAGLYSLGSTGQLENQRVQFRLRTRVTSGPGAWSSWRTVTVDRHDRAEFFSSPRVELTSLGGTPLIHDIQVERVTAEPTDATSSDTMIFDSVIEIQHDSQTYAGLAMLALEITANEQINGVPRVKVNCKGVKCRVWDGISDPETPTFVTEYTANPAYHALEILTNETWGMGGAYDDDNVYMPDLIEFAEYCDDVVARPVSGTRPRFACNILVDVRRNGIDWVRAICQTARTQPIASGDVWRFVTDKPKSASEYFTDADIAVDSEGFAEFTIRHETGRLGLVRPNRLVAQFENASQDFQADTLAYPELGDEWLATEPVQEETFKLDGVTDVDQVASELIYRIKRIRALERTIEMTVNKPVIVQPGDRFDLAMSLPGWGTASGRVADGSTSSTIKIDRTVTLTAGPTYVVRVIHDDGSVEVKNITSGAGTYAAGDALSISGTWTEVPAEFETYALGRTGVEVKPFTMLSSSVADAQTLKWKVTAIEYEDDVYSDAGGEVDLPDYSDLHNIDAPPGPLLTLRAFEQDGQVELAWVQLPKDSQLTATFRIYRRRSSTIPWILVPEPRVSTRGAVIEITEPDAGYEFIVLAVSPSGAFLSPYDPRHPIASMALGLSTPPPEPPASPTLTNTGGNTYTLSWTAAADAVAYQVLTGGDTTSLPNVGAEDCLVLARTVETEITGLELTPSTAVRFFVRSIGTSGRLSFTATTVNLATPATPAGEAITITRTYTLSSEGTLTNLTWNGTTSRLELVSAGSDGVWLSPEQDLTMAAMTEITFRPYTANDADDPAINTDPFQVPSIAADQWGVVDSSRNVGMLMPPWPDSSQAWLFEVRTHDGSVWSDWAEWDVCSSVRRTFRKWQARVTMNRVAAPYRPALRSFVIVATR